MMRWKTLLVTSASFIYAATLHAITYDITPDTKMVGEVFTARVEYNDSFNDLSRRYDIGYYELVDANPHIDPWSPREGASILIPSQFILPPGPHQGIVVNLAELRLYYFSPDGKSVTTFPIGIGSEVWPTPTTTGSVLQKKEHPAWYVPDSIMKEHEERGDSLPRVVPPGPENPLGDYALKLSIPGYLIHGTNMPGGIGRRITHGCMRMFPEDIKTLFGLVSVGTPVRIIHVPMKEAWVDNTLYVELHPALPEYEAPNVDLVGELMNAMYHEGPGGNFQVDWSKIRAMAKSANGVPTAVGGVYRQVGDAEDGSSVSSNANERPAPIYETDYRHVREAAVQAQQEARDDRDNNDSDHN
ncbi:MAG: L,D-transpeptidase family protein [Gammaproteobacteria bacterium]